METSFKFIPSLDGVRALAVVLVLLLHASYGFFKGGWIGVDLFFVLSGYLITTLLQTEYLNSGRIFFKDFYIRRALRLLPALIICVILTNVLWPFEAKGPEAAQSIATLASLFYFANLVPKDVLGPFAQFWSLSVEEHFYFLWPLILYRYLINSPARMKLMVLAAAIVGVAALRIYLGVFTGDIRLGLLVINSYSFTLCRLDSILLGVCLAVYLLNCRPVANRRLSSSGVLVLLCSCFAIIALTVENINPYLMSGGFVLTNLLCLATVYVAVQFPYQAILSNGWVRWVGRRSYGIYLYHFPIFAVLESFRHGHSLVNLLLITGLRLALALVVPALSFRFIEQPISSLKVKFRSGQIGVA